MFPTMRSRTSGAVWNGHSVAMPTPNKAPIKKVNYDNLARAGVLDDPNTGLMLLTTPACAVPMSSVFPEGTFGWYRKLAGHRRRIRKELATKDALTRELRRAKGLEKSTVAHKSKHKGLPFKLKWADMTVVNCAECKRMLLGEKHEPLRKQAKKVGQTSYRSFPPKIACRAFEGRPYCHDCAVSLKLVLSPSRN